MPFANRKTLNLVLSLCDSLSQATTTTTVILFGMHDKTYITDLHKGIKKTVKLTITERIRLRQKLI